MGVPGTLSNSTRTPASTGSTPPRAFTVKLIPLGGEAGPSWVPLRVMISPGEITPNCKLAALAIVRGCGTGAAVTVRVTGMLIAFASTPGAVIVIFPLSVPTCRAAVLIETVMSLLDVGPPVVPVVMSVDSHPLEVLPTLNVTGPPVLVKVIFCAGGDVPLIWNVKLSAVCDAVSVCAGPMCKVTGMATDVIEAPWNASVIVAE